MGNLDKNIADCNKTLDSLKNASNYAKWGIYMIEQYIGSRILEIGGG